MSNATENTPTAGEIVTAVRRLLDERDALLVERDALEANRDDLRRQLEEARKD